MDCRMSEIYVFKRSWREHDSSLVENFDRGNRGPTGWKTDGLCKTFVHQLHQNRTLIPPFEGWPTHFHKVNFNAFFDILSNILEERFDRLRLIEDSIDQIHAQDTDSLLLEWVGMIPHVDMENDLGWFAAGFELEPQTDPTVRLIRSGIVAGGDGINKGEKASIRSTTFV